MKRIAIVCDGYWDQLQGGAELQLLFLAENLLDRGYQVDYVYVDRGTTITSTRLALHPLHLRELTKRVFYPYQALLAPQLFKVLDTIQPSVIINRVGNALTGLCAHYCRTRDLPMLWQVALSTDLVPGNFRHDRTIVMSYLERKLLNYGIRHATFIVAQAAYQDAMLQRAFGRHADLILPNFHPDASEQTSKSDPLIIAWIANLKPAKQPDQFIRLAREFRNCRNLRFLMVGRAEDQRYRSTLEPLLAAANNVEWLGELPIHAANALLSEASIFVNTSRHEGFPNTFIQAWLRRVPVVSLNVDPDGVLSNRGLGLHSGTFETLCNDVRRLVEDPGLRQRIGDRARQYALEFHDVDKNVSRLLALIERAPSEARQSSRSL